MKFSAFLLAAALAAPAARADAPLALAEVLRAAAANMDVAVARSGLAAARADILAADHAPLPQLTLKSSQMDLQHGLGPGNLLTDKRIDKSVGVDWTWERGGKRALRTAAALAAAHAADGDLQDVRRQQLALALAASVDLAAAQQRVAEVAELKRSADELLAAMRARHRAGDISAQDLARADIETGRAGIDLANAEADRRRASLALGRLIGRSDAELRVDDSVWPVVGAPPAVLADAQREALVESRADVQAAQARVDAARAALEGARAGRQSDVTWGVSVDHFPGTSTRLVELRLQMPLQIGYAQQGEIGHAVAQLQQAEDLAARARLQAEADLDQAWQDLAASTHTLDVHAHELLPQAGRVLAQAELAYRKGALPLTDLIDARRSLRAAVLDALAARADHARAEGAWRLLTDSASLDHP
ncbi:TolC family protein [Roseateles cellulosilyticus]|uniref:TolC family protein n=1 Tax=Pelomonas cellulosilytica TaxID=2906762 RepID=A0ABS8Y0D6_9BURK|nr:TolC family protein [Pelomonas sp. P8]MCE4557708.1 TolC family protein [Pelomonas sp. P8]